MTVSVVQAADRLRGALERLSSALASGRAAAILDCELPLVDAIRGLRAARGAVTPAERARLRTLVTEARTALGRCTRLGDLVGAILTTATVPQAYGRRGAPVPVTRRTLSSRT
jgi:hypothetical protein